MRQQLRRMFTFFAVATIVVVTSAHADAAVPSNSPQTFEAIAYSFGPGGLQHDGTLRLTVARVEGDAPRVVSLQLGYGQSRYHAVVSLTESILGGTAVAGRSSLVDNTGERGFISLVGLGGLTAWAGSVVFLDRSTPINFVANQALFRSFADLAAYAQRSPTLPSSPRTVGPSYVDPGGGGTDSNVLAAGFWGGPSSNWFFGEVVGAGHVPPGSGANYWAHRVWLTASGADFFAGTPYYNFAYVYHRLTTASSPGNGLAITWPATIPDGSASTVTVSVSYSFGPISLSVSSGTGGGCGCGYDSTSEWNMNYTKGPYEMRFTSEHDSNGVGSDFYWQMQSGTPWYSTIYQTSTLTGTVYDYNGFATTTTST